MLIKGKILKSALSLSLLINGASLYMVKDKLPLKVQGLDDVIEEFKEDINDVGDPNNYDYLYDSFVNKYRDEDNHQCNKKVELHESSFEHILNNSKKYPVPDQGNYLSEEYHFTLKTLLSYIIFKLDTSERQKFYHNLEQLKIYESYSTYNPNLFGEFSFDKQQIIIYVTNIKNNYNVMKNNNEDFNTYFYRKLFQVMQHEFNHVLQRNCDCYNNDVNYLFDYDLFIEACAEENTTNPFVYTYYRDMYNKVKLAAILDKKNTVNTFDKIVFNDDFNSLYKYFSAETKEEKIAVISLIESVNLSNKKYFNAHLLKHYCTNLVDFVEKNNIDIEENIYLFKSYFELLVSDNKDSNKSIEVMKYYKNVLNAYKTYLSKYYDMKKKSVSDKMYAIDIYHEENGKTSGLVPKQTLKKISTSKQEYLAKCFNIPSNDFIVPVSMENYYNGNNFEDTNNFMELLDSSKKTYIKK